MKRPALQNKWVGVLRMAFRSRKNFGSFERPTPGQLHGKHVTMAITAERTLQIAYLMKKKQQQKQKFCTPCTCVFDICTIRNNNNVRVNCEREWQHSTLSVYIYSKKKIGGWKCRETLVHNTTKTFAHR